MTKSIRIRNIELGRGIPAICVPITGRTGEEILSQAAALRDAGADMAEWRADFWTELTEADQEELGGLLGALREVLGEIPLIFTIRTISEGGTASLTQERYEELLVFAARGGADLVDLEIFTAEPEEGYQPIGEYRTGRRELERTAAFCAPFVKRLQDEGAYVIASSHDFEKTEGLYQMIDRYKAMERSGADILKLAVMPQADVDVEALMAATSSMSFRYTDKPVIAMSMGLLGSISRTDCESYGSCVTFGTVGEASAPGQFPLEVLRERLAEVHRQIEQM